MIVTSIPNATGTDNCVIHTNFGTYIVYITVIISFVSICECLAVIFVTWFTHKLHGNTHILVASLAVNDLLLSLSFTINQMSVVPYLVSPLIKSKLFMSLVYGISSASTQLSFIHMAVIAVDRYIQIAHPFYYIKAMTKKTIYVILLCLWITYLIFCLIPLTAFYDDKYHKRCIILHQPMIYSFVGVALYFLNLIMVFMCYSKIAHLAFKHKQSTISRRLGCHVSQADIELRDNVSAALRSVKYFALMFGVFFICTCPPFLLRCVGLTYSISENIYVGFFSLVPIHAAVNFLIYAFKNQLFYTSLVRKMLLIQIHCCRCERDA